MNYAERERNPAKHLPSIGAVIVLHIIIGKGGLGPGSLEAFSRVGGAYLAIIGGTAALETTWVEAIEDVDLDDLNPESLWKFRVKDFGPLTVGIDAHGGSLYREVQDRAREKLEEIYARL